MLLTSFRTRLRAEHEGDCGNNLIKMGGLFPFDDAELVQDEAHSHERYKRALIMCRIHDDVLTWTAIAISSCRVGSSLS